jgi:hypothetical protein
MTTMYSQVRDHGVFAVTEPITVEALKLRRDQTAASRLEVDHRLAPLLDKIQAGTATAEEMALVTEVAEDSRILTDRLQRAQRELRVAEEIQEKKDAQERRDRFDDLAILNRRKRAEFFRLYREACIVLGSLCASVDEATQIANSFAADSVAGMMPDDRNAIAEMTEPLDPLPALLDSGLNPTMEFGWNFRISVVPLKGATK